MKEQQSNPPKPRFYLKEILFGKYEILVKTSEN